MAKKKTKAAARPKKSTKAKPSARRPTKVKIKRPAAVTVDGVLKSFEKERVVLNDKLVADRKKIVQLVKKISDLKTDLEDTKRIIVESESAIETLDARRDKEIGVLLSGLGVDLGKVASAAKPKPVVDQGTPLFDDAKTENSKPTRKATVVVKSVDADSK